jgi:PAS domain S-box-containing protein
MADGMARPRVSPGRRAEDHTVQRTAAEIRSATIVELALDAIISIDHEGRVVEFNPAAERMFGYKRDDVMGRQMAELLVPPHLRSAHYAGLKRYLATGEARVLGRRLELEAMRADGSLFPVELAIVRIPLAGPPVFTSYIRDLTAQRKAVSRRQLLLDASAVLSSSLEYEQTLRNLSRVLIPTLADWYFVDVRDEGRGGVRRIHIDHRDPAKLALAKALEDRYPSTREDRGVLAVLRTGRTEWVHEIPDEMLSRSAQDDEHLAMIRELGLRSYVIAPLFAHGHVYGVLGVISAESGRLYDEDDVATMEDLGNRAGQAVENARLFTEVEQQRRQLQDYQTELEAQAAELEERSAEALLARDEADEANRAKSEFLAAMSHELRTPLNAILGYTDLLADGIHGSVSNEQSDRLARIKRSGQHLLSLINNILNFARVEAGTVEYRIESVPMAEVLRATEEILIPQIGEKGLRYRPRNDCGNVNVRADREKLLQILINLVSNAVRHTPQEGRIDVLCERERGDVLISVRDTGSGIPSEKLAAIFEPFVQVEGVHEADRLGVGLGLSISRELARAMHGDLAVHSEVGVGSTFTVRLPEAATLR